MQIPLVRPRPRLEHRAVALALVLSLGIITGPSGSLAGGRELSDAELDEVVAGKVDAQVQEDLLRFHYVGPFGATHRGELDGTLSLFGGPLTELVTGSLVIDRGAQTNLRSLVNMNAVNSQVIVLLNLNITIDSIVKEIRQTNQHLRQ